MATAPVMNEQATDQASEQLSQMSQGHEATTDNPDLTAKPGETGSPVTLTEKQKENLLKIRRMLKEANAPKRLVFIKRVRRAFETLKNNPYVIFNNQSDAYDTLSAIMQGTDDGKDLDLYESNDNVYQMLALAFIAALSPDVPKSRYQPEDADNEEDLMIAQKASLIQAFNERKNNIKALQKLELLFLWCAGGYFAYTRHIVDQNRAGMRREPIVEMVPTELAPDRFICPNCGTVTPANALNPFSRSFRCPSCNAKLTQADFYEGYTVPMPQEVGMKEVPNGMTAMDIFSGLNVDADCDAKELYESLYLDLEGETNVAWIRGQFPNMYQELQQGSAGSAAGGSTADETAKLARQVLVSPSGRTTVTSDQNVGTYSRCWLQKEAFNLLEDKAEADELAKLFPKGVKLVTFSNDVFLQAVPERMMDKWSWCGSIKGMGLYPFGVGDVALDIQRRINDCANTVHAYMDRLAFGTILADVDYIDPASLTAKTLSPGNVTGVKRSGEYDGAPPKSLQDVLYQPQFHIDSHIFQYEPQLIQLAQVLAGVQPQTFGGSDPNVKTMGGQEQALRTAIGRMKLFWDQIREEHAARAQNSVKCSIENMDDHIKVVLEGDAQGDWRTETVLKNQLTGDFTAYPESDEGFPASYEEIQQRIMTLLQGAAKNEWLLSVLDDPDTQKVVARYILPEQIRLPGDRERARVKIMCHKLSQSQGTVVPGPNGQPMVMPSMSLNPQFDDIGLAQTIIKAWCQENWEMAETNPDGFTNVLALLTQASQLVAEAQAKQALMQQAAAAGPGAGGPSGPPAA